MQHPLISYFSRFAVLTPEETEALLDSMLVKKFKKDSFLVQEGEVYEDTYFVVKGCVRQYKMTEDNERSTNFYTEGQWIISLTSFTDAKKSDSYLRCTEDTEVVIGNEASAQVLFQSFPRFETIARAVMETVFSVQQQQMELYLTHTPEQRYLHLLKTNPDLVQRVPQYHIASYLGIEPESLSRIRKRLSKNS